jgi:hypothetical protein
VARACFRRPLTAESRADFVEDAVGAMCAWWRVLRFVDGDGDFVVVAAGSRGAGLVGDVDFRDGSGGGNFCLGAF